MSSRANESSPAATACCIVGGGPAGVMLAWLLAREGVDVTVLERHDDFDRDFRGDTLHPGVLEILAQIGLADQVLDLSHTRMQTLSFHTPTRSILVADLRGLRTDFPFVAMLPQSQFLAHIASDAKRFSSFRMVMGADVRELVEESGIVRGVRYTDAQQQTHEVRAQLTVAADGRNSRMRRAAGLSAIQSAPEIDVMWFRLPRMPGQQGGGYLAAGGYMIVLERGQQWQVGYVIRKGTYPRLREAGIDALRAAVTRLAPSLATSAAALDDWQDVRLLSVKADRLKRWYRPGLLCLGDAAHVMSPVGGVGINYAIQDAVEAANIVAAPLFDDSINEAHLRAVQRRRQWPTRVIQALQAFDQRYLIEHALNTKDNYRLPLWLRVLMRMPLASTVPSRLFAFGPRRVRVRLQGK